KRRIGDETHEADPPAAEDDLDPRSREQRAEPCCTEAEELVLSTTRSAIDAKALHCRHFLTLACHTAASAMPRQRARMPIAPPAAKRSGAAATRADANAADR